jgi:hypothetical protein
MPRDFICPFYAWDDFLSIHCECGQIDFYDRTSRAEYLDRYCCNNPGWRKCTPASNRLKAYDFLPEPTKKLGG